MAPSFFLLVAAWTVASGGGVAAFVPGGFPVSAPSRFVPARSWTPPMPQVRSSDAPGLKALVDPGMAGGVDPAWLHHVFSGLADTGADTIDAAAAAAADASQGGSGGGPIGFLTGITEGAIVGLHDFLKGMGLPSPYGLSIIIFTLLLKGVTFPLTYKQLASTTKMQTLAPKVKEIQRRFANNPEQANLAIQELYKTEEVNPLAGCLPTLAQIPIFISLYRSLLNLAKENALNEPFLWLPSLEGPVFDSPATDTLGWIKDWHDGAPKLGWHDTLAYLTIPLLLVITQSISTQLMQPARDPNEPMDESQQASQNVLKFLPLLIGWFSLNVPSGLGLYWIINNFVSTASTLFIRQKIAAEAGTPVPSPKISLPFTSSEPEVITTPVTQEMPVSADLLDTETGPKGFAPVPSSGEGEVEGEIVMGDGSTVPAAEVTAVSKQPKPSKKRVKRKKKGKR